MTSWLLDIRLSWAGWRHWRFFISVDDGKVKSTDRLVQAVCDLLCMCVCVCLPVCVHLCVSISVCAYLFSIFIYRCIAQTSLQVWSMTGYVKYGRLCLGRRAGKSNIFPRSINFPPEINGATAKHKGRCVHTWRGDVRGWRALPCHPLDILPLLCNCCAAICVWKWALPMPPLLCTGGGRRRGRGREGSVDRERG